MTGYTPAEIDRRAALGLPYATGRDEPAAAHPATQQETAVAA